MTSQYATNAVSSGLDREYYLQVTKEGFPLQKQVPKTIQTYSGPGNEAIIPDGSNYLLITGTVADGALTVDLTDLQNYRNMIGRSLTIACSGDHVGAINVDISGNGRVFLSQTTATTGDVATIATTVAAVCTIHFISDEFAAIQHGNTVTLA